MEFPHAYDKGRKIRDAQDSFCAKVVAGVWATLEIEGVESPEELQWECLVDVLRGRVKVGLFNCSLSNIHLPHFFPP